MSKRPILIEATQEVDILGLMHAESDETAGFMLLTAFADVMKKVQPALDAHDPFDDTPPRLVLMIQTKGVKKNG